MNIVENGSIDWSMFGMAVKIYRRNLGLTHAQLADKMNSYSNDGLADITENQVKRMENGKFVPTVNHLIMLDKLTGFPGRTIALLSSIAEALLMEPSHEDMTLRMAHADVDGDVRTMPATAAVASAVANPQFQPDTHETQGPLLQPMGIIE